MGTWIFPMENYLDFSNSILPVLIALLVFMVIRKLRPGKPTVISVLFTDCCRGFYAPLTP